MHKNQTVTNAPQPHEAENRCILRIQVWPWASCLHLYASIRITWYWLRGSDLFGWEDNCWPGRK